MGVVRRACTHISKPINLRQARALYLTMSHMADMFCVPDAVRALNPLCVHVDILHMLCVWEWSDNGSGQYNGSGQCNGSGQYNGSGRYRGPFSDCVCVMRR